MIVYGLIEREGFALADVLDLLQGLRLRASPDHIKEALTWLELAFLIGRESSGALGVRYRWRVPVWRDFVPAEEPARMLARELE